MFFSYLKAHIALLKVQLLKAVNVDYNFCHKSLSVPILCVETDQKLENLFLSQLPPKCIRLHLQQPNFKKLSGEVNASI